MNVILEQISSECSFINNITIRGYAYVLNIFIPSCRNFIWDWNLRFTAKETV